MFQRTLTRTLICGIVSMLLTITSFSGCLSVNNDENEFSITDSIVSEPYVNNLSGDQILVGGADISGVFHHIYIEPPDHVMKYNNETGEITSVFTDLEIRDWALLADDLYVYNMGVGTDQVSYDHEITHIDLETGEAEEFMADHIYGPGNDMIRFIIVGAAGKKDEGVFIFRSPDDEDGWDLVRFNDYGQSYVETNIQINEVLAGTGSGNYATGLVDEKNNLILWQKGSGSFERTLELENSQDICLRGDNGVFIQDNKVYTFNLEDPVNFTFIKGTEGALEVDIFEEFILLSKNDGVYVFHGDESIQIYHDEISDVWLQGIGNENNLLGACGTFSSNSEDSGHIDIELDL